MEKHMRQPPQPPQLPQPPQPPHRGGTPPDPLVWDQGGPKKVRKLDIWVNVDLASLPAPPGFLNGPWVQVHGGPMSDADIAAWPYSVGILCKFSSFLSTLHWQRVLRIWVLLEFPFWSFSSFLTNGLVNDCCEKVTRPHVRDNRPILLPSVPVSEGIEIRHGCQFLSSLVRALAKLPGGLGRYESQSHIPGTYQLKKCSNKTANKLTTMSNFNSLGHRNRKNQNRTVSPNMRPSHLFTEQSVTSPLLKKDQKLQKRNTKNDQSHLNQQANARKEVNLHRIPTLQGQAAISAPETLPP